MYKKFGVHPIRPKFETNIWRTDAVIDGKAPREKNNLRKKLNVISLRYIFYYLQRIKSNVNSSMHNKKGYLQYIQYYWIWEKNGYVQNRDQSYEIRLMPVIVS